MFRFLSPNIFRALPLAAALMPLLLPASTDHERDAFFEWIRVEQEIVAERTDWMRDRELLHQEIQLLRQELKAVEEQIEAAEDTATRTERRRLELVVTRDQLIETGRILRRHLQEETSRLLESRASLPPPLREETEPLIRRLSQAAADSSSSIGEGIQALIAVLHRLQRFDQTVTVETRLLDLPGGDRREVRTIYLGLSIGYFVDDEGQRAGFGQAEDGDWQWTSRDDLGPDVKRLIEVARQESEPAFVPTFLRLGSESREKLRGSE